MSLTAGHQVLCNRITTIHALWIGKNKIHFLSNIDASISWIIKLTLENCWRRLLGSRDVVIIILGSLDPANAYSSSSWVVGAFENKQNKRSHHFNFFIPKKKLTGLRFIVNQIMLKFSCLRFRFLRQCSASCSSSSQKSIMRNSLKNREHTKCGLLQVLLTYPCLHLLGFEGFLVNIFASKSVLSSNLSTSIRTTSMG